MDDVRELLIALLFGVVAPLLVLVSTGLVGGWLDTRASQTPEEVRRDLEQYGPTASGLKVHLLPPDEREAVLAARAEAGRTTRPRKRRRRHNTPAG